MEVIFGGGKKYPCRFLSENASGKQIHCTAVKG